LQENLIKALTSPQVRMPVKWSQIKREVRKRRKIRKEGRKVKVFSDDFSSSFNIGKHGSKDKVE